MASTNQIKLRQTSCFGTVLCMLKGSNPISRNGSWNKILLAVFPLSVPDEQWLRHVQNILATELDFKRQTIASQRARSFRQRHKQDWMKGGRLHALAIKTENFGTLTSLQTSFQLKAKLMKSTRDVPAKLKLQQACPQHVVGSTLTAGKKTWTICSVHGDGVIALD